MATIHRLQGSAAIKACTAGIQARGCVAVHLLVWPHACVCERVCVYIYTYVCVCVCVYTYIHTYMHSYIYIYTHTHIDIYV
jgi:hypothetical protein